MLTRYGTDNIVIMLTVGVLLLLNFLVFSKPYVYIPLMVLGLLLILFTLWFFRDPDRTLPKEVVEDSSLLISPADGKVVEIVDEEEPHYIKARVKRISIFLSPLDVHVNRIPMGGKVEYYDYKPGDYLVAYHPKSSEKNEQSRIGVATSHGKIFFKQIVGIVARRLVCELKVGDEVRTGERFGMMKFGSRMDIMVAPETEIYCKVGDRVVAGESIMAKLKK